VSLRVWWLTARTLLTLRRAAALFLILAALSFGALAGRPRRPGVLTHEPLPKNLPPEPRKEPRCPTS
jgi:hypothetical protein